ncbi:MAG: DUF3226 domain-containing protein [Chloroflexota bacterium]
MVVPERRPLTDEPVALLVEGELDQKFLIKLTNQLNLPAKLWIEYVDGVKNFGKGVANVVNNPAYRNRSLKILVILGDADDDPTNALDVARNALIGNGFKPHENAGALGEANRYGVRSGVYIFPSATDQGYVEDLFIKGLMTEPDDVMACVEDVQQTLLDCLFGAGRPIKPHEVSKFKMELFVLARRGKLPTRALHEIMFNEDWFPWDSGAFDDIKQFLHMLANAVK